MSVLLAALALMPIDKTTPTKLNIIEEDIYNAKPLTNCKDCLISTAFKRTYPKLKFQYTTFNHIVWLDKDGNRKTVAYDCVPVIRKYTNDTYPYYNRNLIGTDIHLTLCS